MTAVHRRQVSMFPAPLPGLEPDSVDDELQVTDQLIRAVADLRDRHGLPAAVRALRHTVDYFDLPPGWRAGG